MSGVLGLALALALDVVGSIMLLFAESIGKDDSDSVAATAAEGV